LEENTAMHFQQFVNGERGGEKGGRRRRFNVFAVG
jgi:hypothetical protein